ncbi:sodium:solute symporter [Flavisolibacter ginsengisoli]|jgi:SSS family transporter|uniref:Transporter, SSS family n=1 Tax=Flavisolibacter ginsengisoli DSM 18119 TaxID=1121884 RepID=A0A1M4U8D4_9BACT|nr:sodium:solute symporter [Flavisolibacter ginsengisoli]SHE52888.1 transporter, SSS family [Flavisolibacter ginsengisoli DSM 18119]
MTKLDWIIIFLVLTGIVVYGLYKSRTTRNLDGYFLSNRSMPWYLVLLSIMGTQASAITFLSGPGQAFADGMRFVQYYFGLPLAMVVICITFVPMFNGLKVYTAYEFLEKRFDGKTRTLTSFLFLLQRGLSTGISIYAPSIILSSLFGWDIYWTNIIMGGLLIIYTVAGGARAVAYTQKIQLVIIFFAMAMAGYMVVKLLPGNMGFSEALEVSGKLGKLNVITSGRNENGFNWNDRYNIWSGIIGGFFLALSYFGTDQSQVGRYLTAQNNTESRLGLLMNGLIKIPMQFSILLIGVLVFAFYQFNNAPLSFNDSLVNEVQQTSYKDSLTTLQAGFDSVNALKSKALLAYTNGTQTNTDVIRQLNKASEGYREAFKKMSRKATGKDTNDTNYVFLSFVKHHLPAGLKGLLIAVIFLAAWGSIAAALNSLAASTVCDFHQQIVGRGKPVDEYRISKWYTLAWGVFSILIAQSSSALGQSLIEAVNVLGSLFYGVILGIFLVAFYFKKINGTAVFIAAVIVECCVVVLFFNEQISFMNWLPDISFLWMNVIGAIGVVFVAAIAEMIFPQKLKPVSTLQPSLSSLEE